MEKTSYSVVLNLKMPWLTKTLFSLFIACLIILALYAIYMIPAVHSSDEMKAAYFVLTTNEFEKLIFVIGILGTPTFFLLYKYVRIRRHALLNLLPDNIEIDTFKTCTSYSIDEITDIACNDALTRDGFPKGELTIDLKTKNDEIVSMKLSDYGQSEQLMNTLLNYRKINFSVTNFSSNPEVLDTN